LAPITTGVLLLKLIGDIPTQEPQLAKSQDWVLLFWAETNPNNIANSPNTKLIRKVIPEINTEVEPKVFHLLTSVQRPAKKAQFGADPNWSKFFI
jgi:hypothetical protein